MLGKSADVFFYLVQTYCQYSYVSLFGFALKIFPEIIKPNIKPNSFIYIHNWEKKYKVKSKITFNLVFQHSLNLFLIFVLKINYKKINLKREKQDRLNSLQQAFIEISSPIFCISPGIWFCWITHSF